MSFSRGVTADGSCCKSAEFGSNEETVERLKAQLSEVMKKESVLAMRLVTKDQEQQDLLSQIAELKAASVPGASSLRTHLVDPAVNFVFHAVRKEQEAMKQKLEDTQNELSAWKFTPDSQRGKMLMAKCRQLYQENEELGKVISSGRLAKLEGDLALHKNFCKELKKSQTELEELLGEQDEDIEGMQSVIYLLQREVKQLKEENERLKAAANGDAPQSSRASNGPVAKEGEEEEGEAVHQEAEVKQEKVEQEEAHEAVSDERTEREGVQEQDEEVDEGEGRIFNGDLGEEDADVLTQSELVSSSRDRDRHERHERTEAVNGGGQAPLVEEEAASSSAGAAGAPPPAAPAGGVSSVSSSKRTARTLNSNEVDEGEEEEPRPGVVSSSRQVYHSTSGEDRTSGAAGAASSSPPAKKRRTEVNEDGAGARTKREAQEEPAD